MSFTKDDRIKRYLQRSPINSVRSFVDYAIPRSLNAPKRISGPRNSWGSVFINRNSAKEARLLRGSFLSVYFYFFPSISDLTVYHYIHIPIYNDCIEYYHKLKKLYSRVLAYHANMEL